MKRATLILIVIGVALSLFLTGCPKKTPPPPPPKVEMPEPRIEEPVVEPKVEQKLDLRAVYFDYDKFNVRDDQKARLTDDAEMLIKFPSSKVELQGHCDERGTEEYNVALGQKRARAVYDFLTQYGISANRLVAKTYGEERPTCSDHNEDCWWRNRRVEFIVVQ